MNSFRKAIVSVFATMSLVSPAQAIPFADTVVSFIGGTGFGVETFASAGSSYVGPSGSGTFDPSAVTALDGVSLALGGGLGGQPPGVIVLAFTSGSVIDGVGADLAVYDSFSAPEGFIIDVSSDGSTFFSAGSFFGGSGVTPIVPTTSFSPLFGGTSYRTPVDISSSGLTAISFVRLTPKIQIVSGYPQAYDLDAIEALNFSASVPEPTTLLLLGLGLAGLGFARRRL